MDRPYTHNRLTMIQVQKNSSLSIINTFVTNKLSRPVKNQISPASCQCHAWSKNIWTQVTILKARSDIL